MRRCFWTRFIILTFIEEVCRARRGKCERVHGVGMGRMSWMLTKKVGSWVYKDGWDKHGITMILFRRKFFFLLLERANEVS